MVSHFGVISFLRRKNWSPPIASPRQEKQCIQVWRQKMKRLIFGEYVKSAENPCRKQFDINPETSGRHISGIITDIATIRQKQIFRAPQSTSLSISIFKVSTVFSGQFFAAFRDFLERAQLRNGQCY
jgi:hypothetical protein